MQLETIIGLEIHIQLKTKSKLFCKCKNDSENAEPNSNTCSICLGHPGVLPVINQQAVDWAVLTALALDCKIPEFSKFDRKNYFYPDLAKGYQISQYDQPIGLKGKIIITLAGKRKRIGITRLHLEEDAAKMIHPQGKDFSLIDFNRGGTPLVEIVTEPEIKSPEEAKVFLQELKLLAQYLNISDADMEKGELRCDANISLKPIGDLRKYPKTEIKNLNSFRAVEKALKYEIERQTKLWEEKNPPQNQSTRGWSAEKEVTIEQRTKEEAHDYRYFPEPDLPPLHFTKEYVEKIKIKLPELPDEKRKRFIKQFGITLSQAIVISSAKKIADFFESTVTELKAWVASKEGKSEEEVEEKLSFPLIKLTVNWITTELFRLLNAYQKSPAQLKITSENMAEFIAMVYENEINSSAAQLVLKDMFEKGSDPSQVVEEKNLKQLSNVTEVEKVVKKVIKENNEVVDNYQKGKQNALQFLIGQVMKETKGKVNPKVASELLVKFIKK